MKKRFAIFIALLLAASLPLSSCGNQTQTESGTDTETTENTGTAEAEQAVENDPATLDELPTDNKDYQDYTLALSGVNLIAGDMQSDFGIIPVPKLNEAQDQYYSTFQYNNAHSLSVPKSAQDLTRTGLITEALQMFSHDTVLPAYYDYTLTNRNARDTDSAEMLDLIFASRNFDISLAYNNKTGVLNFLQTNAVADSFDYASKEAANRQKVEKAVDEIIEKVLHGGE